MSSIPANYTCTKTKQDETTYKTQDTNAEIVKFKVKRSTDELILTFNYRSFPVIKKFEKHGIEFAFRYIPNPKFSVKCTHPVQNVLKKLFTKNEYLNTQNTSRPTYFIAHKTNDSITFATSDTYADIALFELRLDIQRVIISYNLLTLMAARNLKEMGYHFENCPKYQSAGCDLVKQTMAAIIEIGTFSKDDKTRLVDFRNNVHPI